MRQTSRLREGRSRYARSEFLMLARSVHAIAAKLKLERTVSERAEGICADAAAMGMTRFLPRPALAAAAVCIASREHKAPVTQRDLAEAAGCELRDVGRCYETILEEMGIPRPDLNGGSYLQRIATKNPLQKEVYKIAEEMIAKSSAAGLNGRNPMTMAAAALYIASGSLGQKVTQAEVADAAGVAEESVRECCKAIRTWAHAPRNRTSGQAAAAGPHGHRLA